MLLESVRRDRQGRGALSMLEERPMGSQGKPPPSNPPPGSSPVRPPKPADQATDEERHKALDQELDKELDGTFPASDPLPWNHKVD